MNDKFTDRFTEDFIKEQFQNYADALNEIENLSKTIDELTDCGSRAIKAERKVENLHKIIEKQQLKIERQAENISTLLHLYTSGERSQAHKRLREKYKTLKKAYRNLREQTCTKN